MEHCDGEHQDQALDAVCVGKMGAGHPRRVDTFFSRADLERLKASCDIRRDPLALPVDSRIAGRLYQKTCIDVVCREIISGRRKMLIEMATGTGKTRTSACGIPEQGPE